MISIFSWQQAQVRQQQQLNRPSSSNKLSISSSKHLRIRQLQETIFSARPSACPCTANRSLSLKTALASIISVLPLPLRLPMCSHSMMMTWMTRKDKGSSRQSKRLRIGPESCTKSKKKNKGLNNRESCKLKSSLHNGVKIRSASRIRERFKTSSWRRMLLQRKSD